MLNNCSDREKLGIDLLLSLWDILIADGIVPSEGDLLYKILHELIESNADFLTNLENAKLLFKQKVVIESISQKVTSEGFKFFRSIFLLINEKLGKITAESTILQSKVEAIDGPKSISANLYRHNQVKEILHSYLEVISNLKASFGYRLLTLPSDFEGAQFLWDIVLQSESEEVNLLAMDFLCGLYSSIDQNLQADHSKSNEKYLEEIMKNLGRILSQRTQLTENTVVRSCLRCLRLIKTVIEKFMENRAEILKSHDSLVTGELLHLSISNEVSEMNIIPKKLKLKVPSNTSLYELKMKIVEEFNAFSDELTLRRCSLQQIITEADGYKTLKEAGIKTGEILLAAKRKVEVPTADLLLPDGSLNPALKKIFIEWFEQFSEDGKMSAENVAAFIGSCTGENITATDDRVNWLFSICNRPSNECLTQEEFISYYHGMCNKMPHIVWHNLSTHNVRRDLKSQLDIEREKYDVKQSLRYLFSSNSDHFKLLFSLFEQGGIIAQEAYQLISSLPTSPEIFKEILTGGRYDENTMSWEEILDARSVHTLIYKLYIIEWLLTPQCGDDEVKVNSSLPELIMRNDLHLQEIREHWRTAFVVNGGFEVLFRIFQSFMSKVDLNFHEKVARALISKIIQEYLIAAIANKSPKLPQYLSFVSMCHLPLDSIEHFLASGDKAESAIISSNESGLPKDKETEKHKTDKKTVQRQTALTDELSENHQLKILSVVSFKEIIAKIISQTIALFVCENALKTEDFQFIEHSIRILVAVLIHDRSLIDHLFNPDNQAGSTFTINEYLLGGLSYPTNGKIRACFSHAIYILAKNTLEYKSGFFCKQMINFLYQNLVTNKTLYEDASQYYELLCNLLQEATNFEIEKDYLDKLNLEFFVEFIVDQLKSHASTETTSNFDESDAVLIGLLKNLEKLLRVNPLLKDIVGDPAKSNFVNELFTQYLFDCAEQSRSSFPNHTEDLDIARFFKDYVKCKSTESRKAAYNLLITLCKEHKGHLSLMLEALQAFPLSKLANLNLISPRRRSPAGYVGIRNLGCVDPISCMLQQFYMTPPFRYAVLMADDKKEQNLVAKDINTVLDDNDFHQLQKLFGFLELSDRQDYDPHEYCFSFKDMFGNPTNVYIQQDPSEFLCDFFSKIEMKLKGTPFEKVSESVFGGKSQQQIICNNCKAVKKRDDAFVMLSLEVKNNRRLDESMEKYISGEIIDDWNCESCNLKVSMKKRSCISQLPNVLILSLQRTVLNWDSLTMVKINSRWEFPTEFNFEPYTKEGLEWREKLRMKENKLKRGINLSEGVDYEPGPGEATVVPAEEEKKKHAADDDEILGPYLKHPKEYYEYRLVGVGMHIGQASTGHYFSYINTDREGLAAHEGKTLEKWFEFNDSFVRPFNPQDIPKKCFGGTTEDSCEDTSSAVVLFYEKDIKSPIQVIARNESDKKLLESLLDIPKLEKSKKITIYEVESDPQKQSSGHWVYEIDYDGIRKFIPSHIYQVNNGHLDLYDNFFLIILGSLEG